MKTWLVAAVALSLGGACDKNNREDELPVASKWHDPNQAAGPEHGASGDPHAGMGNPHGGMAGDPHAGMAMGNPHAGMGGDPHAGVDMGGGGVHVSELGLPPPDPERPIDASKYLQGTLVPTAATKQHIPANAIVFLSVKRADPQTGEPSGAVLAVERLVAGTWPLWFKLTEAQAMIGGTQFAGDVVITAFVDQDGDAISRQPGDVTGQVRATIPADNLELKLDTMIQ